MEVEKLFKISIEYLSDYLRVLLTTIRSPKLEFQPVEFQIDNPITQGSNSKVVQARLNPKLLGFLLISIFIGSVLNTQIPNRSSAPEFVITLIIVTVCWLLFSSLIHVFCKVFAGRGSFIETLSVNLQVFAVIYVLSSFAAFLWGSVITGFRSGEIATNLQGFIGVTLTKEPIYAYFVVQFILVLIYLPLANKRVHRFSFSRLSRWIPKGAFSAALSLFEYILFYIVFLALTVMIVELSKTNYHIHKVPLSTSESSYFPEGRTAAFWDLDSGTEMIMHQDLADIMALWSVEDTVALSPDGKSLVTVNGDGTQMLWDLETGALERILPRNSRVFYIHQYIRAN